MKHKPLFLLRCLLTALAFYSCHGPQGDPPCTDPVVEYPVNRNAAKWMLQPIRVGDTLKFNVFHRDNRSSPYVFRKREDFRVKDTIVKKFMEGNVNSLNCNPWMIKDHLVADIGSGNDSMDCKLGSTADDQIIFLFKYKIFGLFYNQLTSNLYDWDDSLKIGAQTFYDVKHWQGINDHDAYADSTYVFYNLQYGPLKFIVNDTLIYQRILH